MAAPIKASTTTPPTTPPTIAPILVLLPLLEADALGEPPAVAVAEAELPALPVGFPDPEDSGAPVGMRSAAEKHSMTIAY